MEGPFPNKKYISEDPDGGFVQRPGGKTVDRESWWAMGTRVSVTRAPISSL